MQRKWCACSALRSVQVLSSILLIPHTCLVDDRSRRTKSQHNRDIEFAPRERRATTAAGGTRGASSAVGDRSSQLADYCLATAIELELII